MHPTASTMVGGSGFEEGTRPARDKLERRSQKGSMKNGTNMGRSRTNRRGVVKKDLQRMGLTWDGKGQTGEA